VPIFAGKSMGSNLNIDFVRPVHKKGAYPIGYAPIFLDMVKAFRTQRRDFE
jgi:hypothetical protein